jgi:hypothetical protein
VGGEATCTDDGAIVIEQAGSDRIIRIEPKPDDPIFRWLVTVDGRQRPVVSLPGVMRHVRAALDPDYSTTRARVSVASLLGPS